MPIGSIGVFDEGYYTGTVEYDAFAEEVKLSSVNRELKYTFDIDRKPEKVYIIINIERKKGLEPKWRLWLNDFSLTKEFRPNIEIDTGNSILSSIIYDITPVVREGKNEFSIVYKGLESIIVDSVSHVVFYPVKEFETKYELRAGVLLLKPKENVKFDCLGECYIIAKNPSKEGSLEIGANKIQGDSEVVDLKIEKEGSLNVSYDAPENSRNYGRIYSLFSFKYKIPNINLDISTTLKDGYIEIKILNQSEIELDKILVNVFVNSLSVNFKSFNNVEKGKVIEYKVPLTNTKGNISLRVVGVKAGYRKIYDKNILNM